MAQRIPQQFIDELMTRADIVEIIDARVPLKKSGREYTACCPFHTEQTPSFTVSPEKQFYHCFGCGAHGTVLGFLMAYEHMEFIEAVEALATQVGLDVPQEQAGVGPHRQAIDLYAVLERAADFYRRQLREHPQSGRVNRYLKERQVNRDVVEAFGLGFAPPGWNNLATLGVKIKLLAQVGLVIERENGKAYDRFRDRLLFPIRDRRGRVIAFGGRLLREGSPKYLNSPETPLFQKGHHLYGLYEARKASRELRRILVVEGYMDVIALAQQGIPYAVGTLGTAITSRHIEQLFRLTPEVVFCFDGDRAGRQAAWRALENSMPMLKDGRQARFAFLPEGEDPDSLVRQEGKERFEARISQGAPLSEFLFEQLERQVDMKSIDGRARLVELMRPTLSNLTQSTFRDMLVERLAKVTGLTTHRIHELVASPRATSHSRATPQRSHAQQKVTSPVRLALMLLLQHPGLAQKVPDISMLKGLDVPGVPLLSKVLELLVANPHLNTAAILEHWRGTDDGRHLVKLAYQRHVAHPPGSEGHDGGSLEKQFLGVLEHFRRLQVKQRWNELFVRVQQGQATPEEKAELKSLVW
jgi:DNA primase